MLLPYGVCRELYRVKMEQWLLLRATHTLNASGKRLSYKAFDTNSRKHTQILRSKKLEVVVQRPEMLNVIQIFFLNDMP